MAISLVLIFFMMIKKQFACYCLLLLFTLLSAYLQNQYHQAQLNNPILKDYNGWVYVRINKPLILSQTYKEYSGSLKILDHIKTHIPIILSEYSPIEIKAWPKLYWLKIKNTKQYNGKVYANIETIGASKYNPHSFGQLKSRISQWIWQTNGPSTATAILMAISLGNRAYLTNQVWLTFGRTGTSHLLAIAGLHLGVMVFLIWQMMAYLWQRSQWAMQCMPKQVASISIAVLGAVLYGWFTGWAIPCERAAIMIAVLYLSQIGLLHLTMTDRVLVAFSIIVVVNPLDIYSQSYWLSFIAVTSICYGMQMRPGIQSWFKQWLYLNLIITCSLLPWSLYFFGQYALLGWLANLIAVPWVAFILLPVVFFAVLIQPLFPMLNLKLWHISVICFQPLWRLLSVMCHLHIAYIECSPSIYFCLLYMIGYVWLFAPKAMPGRFWSLVLMLPLLLNMLMPIGRAGDLKPIQIGRQKTLVIRKNAHILIVAAHPNKMHLNQWDYKKIAALVGPYGAWTTIQILSHKILSSTFKNSI